eukprot:COSAG02_NODE_27299_length_612_cov_2.352827_1_plen_54_part_01
MNLNFNFKPFISQNIIILNSHTSVSSQLERVLARSVVHLRLAPFDDQHHTTPSP